MAHDDEFLQHTLQNALQVDEFTASLYNIWIKVREEGVAQVLYNLSHIMQPLLYCKRTGDWVA